MKKKVVGIVVCMLLILTTLSVSGEITRTSVNTQTDAVINSVLNNNKWKKTFNLNYEDGGSSVQQTPDGGYIMVGGTIEKMTTPDVAADYWLIKTDSQGNILWDKVFGGRNDDIANMIKLTNDGGYIIIGSTESPGAGENDVWLVKTDSNGNMMWNKTFGGIYQDFGEDIEQTNDGGYIIVGLKGVSEAQKDDAWLIKTDEFGNMVWNKTYGGSGMDTGHSVVQTLDGGYVVAGYINWGEGALQDAWLFKTDNDGELLWEKTFYHATPAIGYSVDLTDDGGFVLTGVDSYYSPDANAFLIKTDNEGETLWEKLFGEGHDNYGFDVHQTSDGGYIIIGCTNFFYNDWGPDGLLIKTDTEGEEEWSKTYGNKFLPNLIGRGHQTSDDGYILIGWAWKHLLPWPFLKNFADLLLIKTDSNGNTPHAKNVIRSNIILPRVRTISHKLLLRLIQQKMQNYII